jgi:hypothetical protein
MADLMIPSPQPGADEADERSQAERAMEARLATMPREIGVLLVTIGVFGMAMPGIVGTPALLAGGLMLWPRGFRSVNGWLRRRCPGIHGQGIGQLMRYLDDMERRYPVHGPVHGLAQRKEPVPRSDTRCGEMNDV